MDKDGAKAKIHLWRLLTSLPRRKNETYPKSSTTIEKKAIMLISVFKRGKKSQKTSDGLGNFHANNYS